MRLLCHGQGVGIAQSLFSLQNNHHVYEDDDGRHYDEAAGHSSTRRPAADQL